MGRTTIGANQLPAAAVFASAEDEIAFVGKAKDAARFVELAEGLSGLDPRSAPGRCGGRSSCWNWALTR